MGYVSSKLLEEKKTEKGVYSVLQGRTYYNQQRSQLLDGMLLDSQTT